MFDIRSTAQSIAAGIGAAILALTTRHMRDAEKARRIPLLTGEDGQPVYRIGRDKLGNVYRIFRGSPLPARIRSKYGPGELRVIRARNGVGRPCAHTEHKPPMQAALTEHGSQRAAARALGIALSTFQRRLAKEVNDAVAS